MNLMEYKSDLPEWLMRKFKFEKTKYYNHFEFKGNNINKIYLNRKSTIFNMLFFFEGRNVYEKKAFFWTINYDYMDRARIHENELIMDNDIIVLMLEASFLNVETQIWTILKGNNFT